MQFLSAQSISLVRNKKTILDSIHLSVDAGEFIGVIGPNGAGKSSLLRILSGLIKPSAGAVSLSISATHNSFELQPMDKMSAVNRARFLAYLAQQDSPAWPLSVKHLVALGRIPWDGRDRHSAQHDEWIERALRMTDVHHLADQNILSLSGGELQRVLLARVFAGHQPVIIADEPIAALDVYHQLHMMELLQAHAREGGAVIAALHDLSLASRFCSRLILLHHGKIHAQGQAVAVLTPQHLADVYGIRAHVDCRDDGVVIIPRERVVSE